MGISDVLIIYYFYLDVLIICLSTEIADVTTHPSREKLLPTVNEDG